MSTVVNVHEAKTHLSRLLEDVESGGEVVIARAGKPVARLVPISPASKPKRLGLLEGRFEVPDDLNEPLPPDVQAGFEDG